MKYSLYWIQWLVKILYLTLSLICTDAPLCCYRLPEFFPWNYIRLWVHPCVHWTVQRQFSIHVDLVPSKLIKENKTITDVTQCLVNIPESSIKRVSKIKNKTKHRLEVKSPIFIKINTSPKRNVRIICSLEPFYCSAIDLSIL